MSDNINSYSPESDALLSRANALLGRHKAAVSEATPIPVLNESVGPDAIMHMEVIPTLTDIALPQSSMPTLNQDLENLIYRKLKQRFAKEISSILQQPTPEVSAAIDQALLIISDELNADISSMVRTAIKQALCSQTQNSQDDPTPFK